MKTTKNIALSLGLFVLLAAPLSGCGGTWQGVKNDWHDMTGSSDSADTATAQSQPAPQPAAAPAQPVQAQTMAPAAQPMAPAPAQQQAAAPANNGMYTFNK